MPPLRLPRFRSEAEGICLLLLFLLAAVPAAGRCEVRVIAGIDPVAALLEELGGEEVRVLRLYGPGVNPRAPGNAAPPLGEAAGALFYFRTSSWLEGRDEERVRAAAGPGLVIVDLSRGLNLLPPSKPEVAERKIFTAALGLDEASYPKEVNPYFWLDPVLAAQAAEIMAAALAGKDIPLKSRALQLRKRLNDLDGEVRERLQKVTDRRMATFSGVTSYFARRYGLREVPVTGVTPGGGPGRQSLKGTVARIRALGVPAVFADPLFPRKPAESAAVRAGVPLLILHPFGTPQHPGYFDMMGYNLAVIEQGLR